MNKGISFTQLACGLFVAACMVDAARAGDQTWTGNGPFPAGAGSRTVHALALDPVNGTLYAGTGSGTVFEFSDSTLSQPPTAGDDSVETGRDVDVTIDVLANDSDPEGALDATSVTIRTPAGSGGTSVNGDGTVTYTPDTGFSGNDSFGYTVFDTAGAESNEATVTVAVNSPPTAQAESVVTAVETAIEIVLDASDPDDDALDFSIIEAPDAGTLSGTPPNVTYAPGAGFVGNDAFTFEACDAQPLCDSATVSVAVQGPLISLSADSIAFGELEVGEQSGPRATSVTNTGNLDLDIGTLAIAGANPGDYQFAADTCSGQILPPGADCSFEVGFKPSATGTRVAEVTISSNAPSSPDTVALSGTGLAPPELLLSPAFIDFGEQPLNVPTPAEAITIMNIGAGELLLELLELAGLHPDDYMIVFDGCSGALLATDETCQVELDFAPLAPGVRQAELAVPSNDPAGPHAVELIGTHDVLFFDGFENRP